MRRSFQSRSISRSDFLKLSGAGLVGAAFISASGCGSEEEAGGSGASLEGADLNIASMSDPYASVLQDLASRFGEETGARVNVDVLGYPNLYSKVTADFVGGTANYDLITTDILWSGEFAENEFTVDLSDRIERDAEEIDLADIPEVVWKLGEWNGKQAAYPLAGYGYLLSYRANLLREAGLEPPSEVEEIADIAEQLNNPEANQYGIVLNGKQGAPIAHQWMAFNAQIGGALLDGEGRPTLNSSENVAAVEFYKDLFKFTPPGALTFDWPSRNTAFAEGLSVFNEGWSVSRPIYDDPESSEIAGNVEDLVAPSTNGLFGGWGIGINANTDMTEEAWEFIKWLTSKDIQKEWIKMGAGGYIRRSTLTDQELLERFPWQSQILKSFEEGDGDFRPRFPEYAEFQDILGRRLNSVLTSEVTPKQALDQAQQEFSEVLG